MTDNLDKESGAANRIKGPRSLPRHIMKKEIGPGCFSYLQAVERRMSRNNPRQVMDWINTDQLYENQLEHVEELMEFDPRFISLYAHTGKVQQNIGVTLSTKYAREASGLIDPMQDTVFMEALHAVMDEMKHGVEQAMSKGKVNPRVLIKRHSSRGHGANCVKGPDAALWTHEVMLPTVLASSEGLFHYEDDVSYILTGLRLQPNSISEDEKTGELRGKKRNSLIYDRKDGKEVVFGKTDDGSDGFVGLRPRHVNAISHTVNLPLMVVNSIFMDNLTEQLKSIWKFDLPRLRDKFIGGAMHAIDFAQFEATQPRELRHYIADYLYSERCAKLVRHIDKLPIAGVYTNFPSGDHDHDVYYWIIDRWNEPELAEEFSPLLSGTGDTAVMGKTIGLANQLAHLSNATGIKPYDLLPTGGSVDSLASKCCINLGDDQANGFKGFETLGYKSEEIAQFQIKHLESISNVKYFDNTLELYPPKVAGFVAWNEEIGNPNSPIEAISHDPLTLILNRVFQEQDVSSPLRSEPIVGLYEGIQVYRESMITYFEQETVDWLVEKTLDILDCPYDEDALKIEAAQRKKDLSAEGSEGDELRYAQMQAVEILGLNNISELDYKIGRDEILEKLPRDILEKIWILIPLELTEDIGSFVKLEKTK